MPVRSGPTLPPSPRVACGTWRTAAVKTPCPRRRRPLRGRPAPSSSMTFWRSAVGQAAALGEQRPGPVGDRPCPGGRRGPASGRARGRRRGPCPPRSPSEERGGPVGAAEQGPDRRGRGGGRHRPRVARTRAAPDVAAELAAAERVDQAGGELGRGPRGDQGERVASRPRGRPGGARRAAGRRRLAPASGCRLVADGGREDRRRSRRRTPRGP